MQVVFLHNFLEHISPFHGAIDTLVVDFSWRLPWVLKPGWIVYFILRFTFGATPADCMEVASLNNPTDSNKCVSVDSINSVKIINFH